MRAALVLIALLAAGCVTPPAPAPTSASPMGAPVWSVGDYWNYTLTAGVYGRTANVTLVVGAANESGYVMGMPEDSYSLDAILFHIPPAGLVARDLSWSVHDKTFAPFHWPLADGDTYETQWATSALKLKTTRSTDGASWKIESLEGSARKMSYTYVEAGAHWFVGYERALPDGTSLEHLELTHHGHGWKGKLRLLDGITVVLLETRTEGVVAPAGPSAPTVAFRVPAGVDTMLVACVAGGAPGSYRAEIYQTAPGQLRPCDASITQGPPNAKYAMTPSEVRNATGAWEARMSAVGQGSATAEVLGYRSWTADLS